MSWSSLYWREASWLWLSLAPLLFVLPYRFGQRKKLERIADPDLLPWVLDKKSSQSNRLPTLMLLLAWIMFCIALAGPRTPRWIPPELRPADSSLMIILDLSASMQAGDLRPNRKSAAIDQIRYWVEHGDQKVNIGLAVFAGHGHLLLPITSDYQLVEHYLKDLDALRLPTLGNNLAEALAHSIDNLQDQPGKKSILVLTDGDLGRQSLNKARVMVSTQLSENAVQLALIGVGGAEKVALPAELSTLLLNENKTILTRRENAQLLELANATDNGHYWLMESVRQMPLDELLDIPAPRIQPDAKAQVLWDEWFNLPLLIGMGFLFLAFHFSNRSKHQATLGLSIGLLIGCASSGLLFPEPASADITAATKYLDQGDYAEARKLLEQEKGYKARYLEGVACYRLEDYSCARQAFAQAAWLAETPKQRGRAAFNLGNAHFQLGEFRDAIVLYQQAAKEGIEPKAVARNLDFAIELADSMKKYLIHLEMQKQRANRLANARDIPEEMLDKLALDITTRAERQNSKLLRKLGKEKYLELVREGVARKLGKPVENKETERAVWLSSNKSLPPDSTIGLLNRLLPLETGLNVIPKTPYRLEGERPW